MYETSSVQLTAGSLIHCYHLLPLKTLCSRTSFRAEDNYCEMVASAIKTFSRRPELSLFLRTLKILHSLWSLLLISTINNQNDDRQHRWKNWRILFFDKKYPCVHIVFLILDIVEHLRSKLLHCWTILQTNWFGRSLYQRKLEGYQC